VSAEKAAPDAVAGATEYATSPDGTRIAFDRTGAGPVIVLVDGAMCFREFGPSRPVAAELSGRFTVVAYDRRGRGESGDTRPYSAEREIEDLRAVMDAVAGDVFVLGQSSGAGLAYRAAAAGVPMRALVGYEAPWVGLRPGPDGSPRDYVGDLDRLVAAGENGKAIDYFMVKMVRGPWFMPAMMRSMRKVWKQLLAVAPTLPNDARVMGAEFRAPVDELRNIRTRTLVLAGSKAAPEMLDAQRTVADAVPGAELRILQGQTHNVAPDVLAPVVAGFFSS
jgi:pimeloyl-ACP methyl ester carboxylesterase